MIFILLGMMVVFYFFYIVLRDEKRDVSNLEPFVEFVELFTRKRCVLAKNPGLPVKDTHPYIMEDGSGWRIEDIDILQEIPLDAEFTISSVELHKGSVSGTTTCYLFGSIMLDGESFSFCLSWGRQTYFNGKWTFPQSFWQVKEYDQEFELPEL